LPLIVDVPGVEMPVAYQRVTVDVDKEKVYQALVAGEDVPNARLGDRGSHVRCS